MAQERGRSGNSNLESDGGPSERTGLFTASNGSPFNHGTFIPNNTRTEDEEEGAVIDDNEFDNMLARAESITTGIGIEVESQETAMLRGARRYSTSTSRLRRPSVARSRRKSVNTIGSTHETIDEYEDEGDYDEEQPRSPYLGGISVARFWWVFSGLLITYFICSFDSTIMASSHPVITSYFHSSNSASWLSTAFLLTSTSFQPLFGRLSDSIGRKPPYIFTTIVFIGATLWCALAQSMMSFIIARAICGLGAGGMMTMGSIITSDLVPIEIRGAYQSYINIVFGAGSALGSALGGAIADSLGWRWEFGMQIPVLFICLLVACFTMPNDLGIGVGIERKTLWEAMKVFDFKGSILLTTTITALILGLNLGGNVYPWSHPIVITALAFFVATFPLFIYIESIVEKPIMPLAYLYRNPHAFLILSNSLGGLIINSVIFNVPLYFQAVLLESATSSGLRLIVPAFFSTFTSVGTGFYITWSKDLKTPLLCGVTFLSIGAISLTFIRRDLPSWLYTLLVVPTMMGGGFMFPATFISVLAASEQAEQAVVTSTLILWRSMGSVLGVATSSFVLQNALYYNLKVFVTGPDRDHVIQQVRKSVAAIPKLDPFYRAQVVESYAASLKASFIFAASISVVAFCLVVRLKVPKLGQKR